MENIKLNSGEGNSNQNTATKSGCNKKPDIKKCGGVGDKSKKYYMKLDEEYMEKYMQKFGTYIEDLTSQKLPINNDVKLNVDSYIFFIEERTKVKCAGDLTPEIKMRVLFLRYSADAILDDINQKFNKRMKKEIKNQIIKICNERQNNMLYFISALQIDKKIIT